MKFWWVFILLSLFLFQIEANPEVRVRITQKGLNYGKLIYFYFAAIFQYTSKLLHNAMDFLETS